MKDSLKGKGSFVIVAYAMPLDEMTEDPRAGVLQKFTYEDAGMVTGKENLMPITALGDHDELEASINSVLMELDNRIRIEIHNFADNYIDQWRAQWPHQQRPWWWAGRHLEELHLKEEDVPIKPTKALMMRVSAGAYVQPVSSQEEAQGLPDPAMRGVSMLMTFNEGQGLDDVSWAAEKTFWLLRAELARYFFSPLKGVLGEGRVATLLKKYGKEVKG